MESDLVARQRLGARVRQARRKAGYANTQRWSDLVGRSDRVLLGLERGEPAGADTYAAVAEALAWPLERIYAILDNEPEQTRSTSTALTDVSDEELVAEVLRRMKAGDGVDRDTAPTSDEDLSEAPRTVPLKRVARRRDG